MSSPAARTENKRVGSSRHGPHVRKNVHSIHDHHASHCDDPTAAAFVSMAEKMRDANDAVWGSYNLPTDRNQSLYEEVLQLRHDLDLLRETVPPIAAGMELLHTEMLDSSRTILYGMPPNFSNLYIKITDLIIPNGGFVSLHASTDVGHTWYNSMGDYGIVNGSPTFIMGSASCQPLHVTDVTFHIKNFANDLRASCEIKHKYSPTCVLQSGEIMFFGSDLPINAFELSVSGLSEGSYAESRSLYNQQMTPPNKMLGTLSVYGE